MANQTQSERRLKITPGTHICTTVRDLKRPDEGGPIFPCSVYGCGKPAVTVEQKHGASYTGCEDHPHGLKPCPYAICVHCGSQFNHCSHSPNGQHETADAHTVCNELDLTPSQIAEERRLLIEALQKQLEVQSQFRHCTDPRCTDCADYQAASALLARVQGGR